MKLCLLIEIPTHMDRKYEFVVVDVSYPEKASADEIRHIKVRNILDF